MNKFIIKKFNANCSMQNAYERISDALISLGMVPVEVKGSIASFKYKSIFFSSKKPASCISFLTMEVSNEFGHTKVRFSISMKKIKIFTTVFVFLLFFVLPPLVNYTKTGNVDFSPFSGLGIPVGLLIYFHVRWRVLRMLKNQVINAGDSK